MQYIDYDWIKPLFHGSIFLGSGGGGITNNIFLQCKDIFSKGLTIPLLDIHTLESNKTYAAVGLIGAPEVVDDFYFSGDGVILALNKLQSMISSKIEGIFTLECAGVNTLYPILIAGLLKIPLIDGDSIGRAFPELQMTTFHLNKQPLLPFILCNNRQKIFEFNHMDNFLLDLNIRHMLSESDNVGFFAACPTKGNDLKKLLIPRTLSLTYEIGKVFTECSTYDHIMNDLIATTKNSIYGACIELFLGEIEKIERVEPKNWESIHIKGIRHNKGEVFQILTQNENLLAYKNNSLAAMVPDLISFINLDTLVPISNSELSKGVKVAVIGTPAPLVWKTADALNVVGPQCFGYKSPYKSLEELYFSYYYE